MKVKKTFIPRVTHLTGGLHHVGLLTSEQCYPGMRLEGAMYKRRRLLQHSSEIRWVSSGHCCVLF